MKDVKKEKIRRKMKDVKKEKNELFVNPVASMSCCLPNFDRN